MPRPTEITDDQILVAARKLFLEKGIQATTAEVARRARVAEGSIFKRFKTKDDLFRAAMEHQRVDVERVPWLRTLEQSVGKREPGETLVEAGLQIVDFFRALMPLMMMSWSNPGPRGLPASLEGPNAPPLVAIRRIARYFEAEMRAGRIKRHDPEVIARAYLGGLQSYVFMELLLKANDELPLPAEMHVRGLVDLLWRGMAPSVDPRAGRRRT